MGKKVKLKYTLTSDDFEKRRERILKAAKEVRESLNIEPEKIVNKYTKEVRKGLNYLAEKTIDDFYDDYEPHLYERTGDLYNAYKVTANPELWKIDIDAQYMKHHGRLNDYIFDIALKRGYHGGADKIASSKAEKSGKHPDPGTPYWRQPAPMYTEWYSTPAARFESPYEQSRSPYEQIEKSTDDFLEQTQKDFEEELKEYRDRLANKLLKAARF